MTKFRKHRGGLAESLETMIDVQNLKDVQVYCSDDLWGVPVELKCKYYAQDNRLGMDDWGQTFIITGIIDNQSVVLGFSNNELF